MPSSVLWTTNTLLKACTAIRGIMDIAVWWIAASSRGTYMMRVCLTKRQQGTLLENA